MTSSPFPPATAVRSPSIPLHFALLTRDPQVREFQVLQDGPAPAHTRRSPASIQPSRRQPATTDSRRVSAKPSPSNSSDSAYGTRRSRSNVVAS